MEDYVFPVEDHFIKKGARESLTFVEGHGVELVGDRPREFPDPLQKRHSSKRSAMLILQSSQVRIESIDPGAHLVHAHLELLLLQVAALKGVQKSPSLALSLLEPLLSGSDLTFEKGIIHHAASAQLFVGFHQEFRVQ